MRTRLILSTIVVLLACSVSAADLSPEATLEKFLSAVAALEVDTASRYSAETLDVSLLGWKVWGWSDAKTDNAVMEAIASYRNKIAAHENAADNHDARAAERQAECKEASEKTQEAWGKWLEDAANKDLESDARRLEELQKVVCGSDGGAEYARLGAELESGKMQKALAVMELSCLLSTGKEIGPSSSRRIVTATVDLQVQSKGGFTLTKKNVFTLEHWTMNGATGKWVISSRQEL